MMQISKIKNYIADLKAAGNDPYPYIREISKHHGLGLDEARWNAWDVLELMLIVDELIEEKIANKHVDT